MSSTIHGKDSLTERYGQRRQEVLISRNKTFPDCQQSLTKRLLCAHLYSNCVSINSIPLQRCFFTCNPRSSSRPAARSSNHTFRCSNSKSIGRTCMDSPDLRDSVCRWINNVPAKGFFLLAKTKQANLWKTYIVVQEGKAGCWGVELVVTGESGVELVVAGESVMKEPSVKPHWHPQSVVEQPGSPPQSEPRSSESSRSSRPRASIWKTEPPKGIRCTPYPEDAMEK